MSYPIYIPIQPGESLNGFAHRLARANSLPHFSVLTDDIGQHYDTPTLSVLAIAALAEKADVSAADLVNRQLTKAPSSKSGSVTLGGAEFQQDMVRIRCSRVCAECVAEGRPHLLNWQFNALTHCLLHRAPLITQCPTCATDLTWRRRRYDLCRRGHDIGTSPPAIDRDLDLTGAMFVDDMLNKQREKPSQRSRWRKGMPRLDCPQTIILLTFLAQIALFDESKFPSQLRFHHPSNPAFLSVGLDLAREWPKRFLRHITARVEPNSPELLPAPKRQWIAKRCAANACPAERLILAELDALAQRLGRLPVAGKIARFSTRDTTPAGFIRRQDFVREAGMCVTAVDAIFGKQNDQFTKPGKGAGPSLIPEKLAAQFIKNKKAPHASYTATARRFMVNNDLVRDMAECGLFGDDAKWRHQHCPWRGLYLNEVEGFENSLRSALIETFPDGKLISLHTINEGPGSNKKIVSLLKAIIVGELPAFGSYRRLYSPRIKLDDWRDFQAL